MVRLGEGAAGEALTLGHFGQPLGLLLLAAEVQDDFGRKIGDQQTGAHRGVAPGQLFGDHDVLHASQPHTGVLLGEMDADESQFGGLLPDFFGVGVLFEQIFDDLFLEFTLDEIPHGLLNVLLFTVQFEFHCYSSLSVLPAYCREKPASRQSFFTSSPVRTPWTRRPPRTG